MKARLLHYFKKCLLFLKEKWYYGVFVGIVLLGLYLRFFQIEQAFSYGWDQARDAWVVKDILSGRYTLSGPKTGIGSLHLGPLYYYFLVPFFYLSDLDPIGSMYFTVVANCINFLMFFYVTKKIFSEKIALFVVLIYATSDYLIIQGQIPWNVSLVPGVSLLLFYSIYQIYHQKYVWFFCLSALTGFFFHLHFTAVFIPVIVLLSLVFLPNKKKALWYALYSLPLALVFFAPTIINEIINNQSNYFRMRSFVSDYYIGFHFRFLLYRLPDSLIQLTVLLYFSWLKSLTYIVFGLYFFLIHFIEKDKDKRLVGYLIIPWFVVPLIGFTLYGGPVPDYYYLLNIPFALYIIVYLQLFLLKIRFVPIFILSSLFWSYYVFANTAKYWHKPISERGLTKLRIEANDNVSRKDKIPFNEGDMKSYLYDVGINKRKNK